MDTIKLLNIFPEQPMLSTLTLLIITLAVLYFGRQYVHLMIKSLMRTLCANFRLASKILLSTAEKICLVNRDVLLHLGSEQTERRLDREFFRINAVVERDLANYPEVQRSMSEQVKKVEENYEKSSEIPPPPPEWVKAVNALTKFYSSQANNEFSIKVFDEIHKSAVKQQKETVDEYRHSMKERHRILHSMLPLWRKLGQSMDQIGGKINRLLDRAKEIDKRMDEYEEIRNGTDRAVKMLRNSSFIQFFVSTLVILVAIGGAIINFNLIALPMSEMVGAASYIGGYKVADIAALVIIFVEAAMGLFLMEALRITQLFPIIGSMDDLMRKKMIWVTLSILICFACVESALAFMRDQIATDLHVLRSSLTDNGEVIAVSSSIPMIGQMVMGFILPFALTFIAIPLESLVQSIRTIFGDLLVFAIRFLALVFRVSGNFFAYSGRFLCHLYDVIIFGPLWLEQVIKNQLLSTKDKPEPELRQVLLETGGQQMESKL